jgi:predicted RecB family nuclease
MSENLTLLKAIRAPVAKELNEIGIYTIEQLANTSSKDLEKDLGLDINVAEEWIDSAVRYLDGNEKPKIPPGEEVTSKYSMKTTESREFEEESQNKVI